MQKLLVAVLALLVSHAAGPKHLMAKTRFLQGASIGFFATNLFCITDWPQFDPEAAGLVNGTNIYPGIETVTFPMTRTYGINIKLQF